MSPLTGRATVGATGTGAKVGVGVGPDLGRHARMGG